MVLLSPAAHAAEGSFFTGSGRPTSDKPQSKLWFHDGTWWAILPDGQDIYFYKLEGGALVKQTFPDALVDVDNSARADVLWNGQHLFVLMYKGASSELYKYSYDASSQSYSLLPGFPVSIPLASGSETAVIEQDSTGTLWIAYEAGRKIRVIWSTAADHTAWDTNGLVLHEPVDSDDIAAIVAFNNQIGVMWSNQDKVNFGFSIHTDGDPETSWGPVEVVSQGSSIADDHINFAVTNTDDLLAATKSGSGNKLNLFIRRLGSGWDGPYRITGDGTRPIVVFDQENEDVYVFYTDWSVFPATIAYKTVNLLDLGDLPSSQAFDIIVPDVPQEDLNDVSSTKQPVDSGTGILVVAKDRDGDKAFYASLDLPPVDSPPLDTTPPEVSVQQPTANTAPNVTITAPTDGSSFTEGGSIGFSGTATDGEEGDLASAIVWTSSLDGPMGTGGLFSTTLSVGAHDITASVTDSGGLNGTAVISVTVTQPAVAQNPPSVLFFDDFDANDLSGYQQLGGTWTTVSEAGRGFVLRQTANFKTIIYPAAESFGGSYEVRAEIWNEDNDEAGLAFRINTADGDNFYSCSATADSGFDAGLWQHVNDLSGVPTTGLAVTPWRYVRQRWYTITIRIDQDTNTINCIWESQEAGVELDVTAVDPNPSEVGSIGIWLSSQDNFKGDLLEVRSLGPPLPPDTVPPEVSVQQPTAGTAYDTSSVDLIYTVTDDVSISECGYELDGVSTALPSCQDTTLTALSLGPHQVQVFATDTSNNTNQSAVVDFTVTAGTTPPPPNTAPNVAITAPTDGSSFTEGESIGFSGTATDGEEGDLASAIVWTSSLDGPVGTGGSFSTTLSVGAHDITASVTDSGGLNGTAVISVTVTQVSTTPDPPSVFPTVETNNVSGNADDPSIWIHPTDSSLSTIIGTDKKSGLAVYDLDGNEIQFLSVGRANNVDLRYNFPLSGGQVDLVGFSNRTNDTIEFYKVNPATRELENVTAGGISAGITVYGFCMYRSPVSGAYYAFVTGKGGGVRQWELFDDGSGGVDAALVRSFDVGGQTEGCVADDEYAIFYAGEENVGLWKYGAEPDDGTVRTMVDSTGSGGHLVADVEGLTIYYASDGTGYLIASSQGNDRFVVYTREGDNDYVMTFKIEGGNGIDEVRHTDGIDVSNAALGDAFPFGVFVAQDSDTNFKLVPWESIAGSVTPPLRVDTTRGSL